MSPCTLIQARTLYFLCPAGIPIRGVYGSRQRKSDTIAVEFLCLTQKLSGDLRSASSDELLDPNCPLIWFGRGCNNQPGRA